MKNNTINLTNLEASRIQSLPKGKKFVLLRLLDKQPPEGFEIYNTGKEYANFLWDSNTGHVVKRKLTYPSGVYGVKETWDIFALPNEVPSICYKAGSVALPIISGWGKKYQRPDNSHKWNSPVTMPKEAIRWHLEIDTVVKRVQELTMDNIIDISHPDWAGMRKTYQPDQERERFISHFNSLYARPRKWKDGYVCYPYDMNNNSISENVHFGAWKDSDNSCYLYTWKGKKLTIFANPFMEVLEGVLR